MILKEIEDIRKRIKKREAFLNLVERDIKNYLPDEYKNCVITRAQLVKKNDMLDEDVLDGLVFQMADRNLAPTVYLNDQYALLEIGTPYLDCLKNISSEVVRAMKQAEKGAEIQMDASRFMNERYLYVQAINKDANREFLKKVPHKIENDLAYVLRYEIYDGDGHYGFVDFNNKKFDELFENAQENMQKDIYIESLTNQVEVESANDLYVLSNTGKYHGAGIVANKEILKKVAEQMGCDFTILPSSIHEIIIVPDKYAEFANISKNDLLQDMKNYNGFNEYYTGYDCFRPICLLPMFPQVKLSDNIYHFDSKEKKLEMIENPYVEKNKKINEKKGLKRM